MRASYPEAIDLRKGYDGLFGLARAGRDGATAASAKLAAEGMEGARDYW